MLRLLAILALVLVTARVSGACGLEAGGRCLQQCADDDPSGNCGVDCHDCSCCLHPTPIVFVPSELPSSPGVTFASPEPSPLAPASRDADEILHIPKALLC